MKTKMLICTGMFAAVAAFAAQPVETKITHEGVWKNAEGVYTQNYPGHDYDSLVFRFPVESDGFYKLSGEFCGTDPVLVCGLVQVPEKEYLPFTHYQFFRKGNGEFRIYQNPGPKNTLKFRNLKVERLEEADLKKNLVPDGEFESGAWKPFWREGRWGDQESVNVAAPSDFLQGKNSLKMGEPAKGKVNALVSRHMPARSNQTVVMTLWAKADTPQPLRLNLDFERQSGKHLYQLKTVALTPEWKEYTFEFKTPELENKRIQLHLQRESFPGDVWIDHVEFREK